MTRSRFHAHWAPKAPQSLYPREPEPESLLSTWLIGGAAIVLWFYLIFYVLLPALT